MQSHNQKKQQYVTAGRYHQSTKGYPPYFHPPASGDVGGFGGGPGGAAGTSLRLNQYSATHPPPAAAPQPPQGPPQLRAQTQPPPHNPHNATAGAPSAPHSQQHHTTHTHATLSQHSQHHPVLQSGGVGGHGTGGVGTGVGQVGGVPPGPSPAPPGPPHEISPQTLPPGSTQSIQQGSGGSLPVVSAHNMMYPATTQNQPQGPQPNAQGQFYPHHGGPNAPPHLHSTGQPRQVTLAHSQHMNFPVMAPNMIPFYTSSPPSNVVYQIPPFQTMGPPRQATPQPGQFHGSPMPPQTHPQPPFQTMQYTPQGGKHESAALAPMAFRQPQPVFYPSTTQQQQLKPTGPTFHRERKLLAIVDPTTGKNILDDIHNEKADSNKSSESSASNTPAPSGTPPNKAEQVDIAAQFAAEVAKKAAEEDTMVTETLESVGRTNKQSENSSSNIIISDNRETKEQLRNSIGNTVEIVNSESMDSGVGKTVPETIEVIKPTSKADTTQVPAFQPISSQPASGVQTPMMLPQMPQQVPMQQVQQQQIPQPVSQQPPMQVLPPPPSQVSQQPPAQVPQQGSQQPPQQKPQQQPSQPLQPSQQQSLSNQLAQQAPHKQKSPSPQQNIKAPQLNAMPSHAPQPAHQPPPPEQVSSLPKQHQQPLMSSPPPQTPQQCVPVNDMECKIENVSPVMVPVQNEVPIKPEPTLPVKQGSPKPQVSTMPPALPTEEEMTTETQTAQSKRRGGPREENTPARENVEENVLPAQPQKTSSPPAFQPPSKPSSQAAQNSKELEKKSEPAQLQSSSTPPPSQQSSSQPPSKEATPQPARSPSPSEESKSERSSKERDINCVEVEVNNIHEDDEKKDGRPQLKYSYKDDQWSPLNPDGKRQYDRRFLLELQNNPLSLKKPESLPNLEVVRDGPGRHKPFDPRGPVSHIGGGPDFTPDYVKPAVIGNKQSRPGVGRNHSQQRRPGEPGGGQVSRGRGGPGKVIVIPLSAGREPKLKTVENAWKPSVMDNKAVSDEQAATEEVVKRMRGILNKLTPEKFEKLVGTVKLMPIDTTERLSAVIDLIFEKAVDEQGFSSTYANLCQVLSKMSVRGEGTDDGKSDVKFRNLIINKCQKEFEKDNMELIKKQRMKEIEANSDTEKKIELQAKWEYDETKLRQRSVGNIRFIGELYKLRMLTSPIMMRIIGTLLTKRDEESLECLCKLLTTIGKILETQCAQQLKPKEELDKQFKLMQKIVSDRLTNSRVRFLMMDVIDLRGNNWIPRREDNKPKTKAEVHEEVKREEFEQQIALANTPNRRDDRDRDRDRDRKRSRDNRGTPMSDSDGWNTVASTKSRTFDSSRLKNTFNRPGASESKEVILRGVGFGNWARGSSGGGLKDHDDVKQQENRFNVLGDSMGGAPISGDNRRGAPMGRLAPGGGPPRQGVFGSKSMPPPSNEKESALSYVKKFVGNDRSKSTSRPESRENSVPRENEALKGPATIDPQAAEKFSIAIIEEYAHNVDVDDAKLWIRERFSSSTIKYFVQYSLEWVLDRDETKRKRVGQLYHDLVIESLLSIENFLEGVQETLSMTEDYAIDIPRVCDYFGEIFAPCLNDNAVSLQRLLEMSKYANSESATVFACIIAKAATLMSPNKVADLWNGSGLSWSDIVPANTNVDDFLAKQHVEFTVDRSKSASSSVSSNSSGWDPQKVEAEFLKLFKRASNAEIFDWIEANIGNDAKTSKFIRALVTALVESQAMTSSDGSSIRATEEFETKMKNRLTVVRRYVDSSDKLELQCIYALQALSVKHQHPPGLLEKCFNAFYDSEVVSEEAFDEWLKSNDPEEQEGKGVCVASVKSFMRWLKEAETEESENQA
ncbi:eukaryotic translation initiation factor 4 gamma 1-like isoform X4 [Macrobrachium rosenbergii]|uniref:eukaryotic translation initiation factor 4 gamma 1-like isoform X4 n=1 Tax=Macrobrachium rosenbergii TaxID=79674 RepID=UPI0034D57FD6